MRLFRDETKPSKQSPRQSRQIRRTYLQVRLSEVASLGETREMNNGFHEQNGVAYVLEVGTVETSQVSLS